MKPKNPSILPSTLSVALGLIALPTAAFGQNYTWSGTFNGTAESWNVDASWGGTPNPFPNAVGDVANLTGDFTAAKVINLNADTTIGTLSINDSGTGTDVAITINGGTGPGKFIFDVASGNASLVSAGATNVIGANIQINDNLDITTTNSLTINGLISEGSALKNLTKATTSANTLTLSNNANSYTGTTSVVAGTLAANLNSNISVSTNSVFGNSGSAIILGTSASNAGNNTTGLTLNAGDDSTNYTMSRGIDLSQSTSTGTASITFAGNGAGSANANKLTLAGDINHGAGLRTLVINPGRSGLTIDITGNITQTGGTKELRVGNFASNPSATDGRGIGTVRFSSLSRSFTAPIDIVMGTALIDGTVGALGTSSPIGTTAIRMSVGSGGNMMGAANFNGNVTAANDTAQDTFRNIYLESAGSSYARILAPSIGTTSAPKYTDSNGIADSYLSNVNVINGYQFGGKNSSGTVTFSGNIASSDFSVGANTAGNVIITAANIALIAESGGTSVFSGIVSDTPDAATEARLTINQSRNNPHLDGVNNTSGNAGVQTATVGSDGIVDSPANALVGTAKTGTVQLNNANTYVGTTEVLGGTLQLGNAKALGIGGRQANATGSSTIASGAVLDLNGQTAINEPIILNGTGISSGGALINNSGTPASIGNGVAGIHLGTVFGSGSGYSTAPTVTITGGGGSGATTATASLGLTTASVAINVGGTGWVSGDSVTITGGNGVGAIGTVVASGGAITSITIVKPGSGYTAAPTTIAKADSIATGAGATITGNAANFTVSGLNLGANSGSAYTSTPTVTFSSGSASATAVLSSVTLASNSSVGGTGDITIGAVISESGGSRSLSKVGAGTATLTAINTYTGETNVSAGKLVINGNISTSSLVTASGTGTLAGSGTVGAASVTSGAALAIGNSPGTMNFSSLSLGSSSTFLYEMRGGDGVADLGDISGNLTIDTGSILDLVELGTYTAGNKFTLFAYDGVLTGNFSGITNNSTFLDDLSNPWLMKYDDSTAGLNGGDGTAYVTITAVPEPDAAMLVGGLGVLGLLRRRRNG